MTMKWFANYSTGGIWMEEGRDWSRHDVRVLTRQWGADCHSWCRPAGYGKVWHRKEHVMMTPAYLLVPPLVSLCRVEIKRTLD